MRARGVFVPEQVDERVVYDRAEEDAHGRVRVYVAEGTLALAAADVAAEEFVEHADVSVPEDLPERVISSAIEHAELWVALTMFEHVKRDAAEDCEVVARLDRPGDAAPYLVDDDGRLGVSGRESARAPPQPLWSMMSCRGLPWWRNGGR